MTTHAIELPCSETVTGTEVQHLDDMLGPGILPVETALSWWKEYDVHASSTLPGTQSYMRLQL